MSDSPIVVGKRPGLQYIDKRLLTVDRTYQREIDSERSQRLIKKIAAHWSWLHCGAIVVAPNGAKFNILDGQHRHAASLLIPAIAELPCVVSSAKDLREQAEAFIALNRDRVSLTGLSIFWSEFAAGEPEAKAIIAACREADVALLRTPLGPAHLKPNHTMALGAIRKLYRGNLGGSPGGRAMVVEILTLIREAYPETPGQLTATMIEAVTRVLANQVKRRLMLQVLKGTDHAELIAKAYKLLQNDVDLKRKDAFYKALWLKTLKAHAEQPGQSKLKEVA